LKFILANISSAFFGLLTVNVVELNYYIYQDVIYKVWRVCSNSLQNMCCL